MSLSLRRSYQWDRLKVNRICREVLLLLTEVIFYAVVSVNTVFDFGRYVILTGNRSIDCLRTSIVLFTSVLLIGREGLYRVKEEASVVYMKDTNNFRGRLFDHQEE
ncbi:unnamed protein product [Adineta ricciae]|uniref:Uncharacterized protein n=1 Tax=Adineta ricciae TaxID=249248 RepID=A0A814IHD0_ADIRI|nr:unnamed protein product [Adineta ricciae]